MTAFYLVKEEILKSYFGSAATKLGSILELGLSETAPNTDGSNITEVSTYDYSRVSIENNNTNFETVTLGGFTQTKNISEFYFSRALTNWGTISHWVLYDSGVPKFFGNLINDIGNPISITIHIDDRFVIGIGKLMFQLAESFSLV
jgi:hypothetical protein